MPRPRNLFAFAAMMLSFGHVFANTPAGIPPRVFLIGGSTMSEFAPPNPMRGWGQAFGACFTQKGIVQNRAASGRSSKSFIDQGRWGAVLAELQAGDYLIIQFGGGNDSKQEDPARFTVPRGSYRANLERIVRETREKQAFPLLATMGAIRAWDVDERFVSPPTEWVDVTREVAAALDVPLLDLRARTIELETRLGPAGSAALHLHLQPGQFPSHPKGAKDDVHYSEYGAHQIALQAAQEIHRLQLPLARWLLPPGDIATGRKR